MLKFSNQNAKTKLLKTVKSLAKYLNKRQIYSLDLPAGWTCPGAKNCKSRCVMVNGKATIKDGPHCQFRCFSASQEVVFPRVRRARQYNFDLLKQEKTVNNILQLLENSMPSNLGILRWHVSGDFYSLSYLRAALRLTEKHPDRLFYIYTKSLHHLAKLDCVDLSKGIIRPNFLVTASYGGKYDHLIKPLNIRIAKVVFSEAEAKGLPIDYNDSHAATSGGNFALLLHGIQPKGTPAAKALSKLKGKGTYGR